MCVFFCLTRLINIFYPISPPIKTPRPRVTPKSAGTKSQKPRTFSSSLVQTNLSWRDAFGDPNFDISSSNTALAHPNSPSPKMNRYLCIALNIYAFAPFQHVFVYTTDHITLLFGFGRRALNFNFVRDAFARLQRHTFIYFTRLPTRKKLKQNTLVTYSIWMR